MRLQGRIPTRRMTGTPLASSTTRAASRGCTEAPAIVPRIENLSTNEPMASANFRRCRAAPRLDLELSVAADARPAVRESLRRRTRILGRPERPPAVRSGLRRARRPDEQAPLRPRDSPLGIFPGCIMRVVPAIPTNETTGLLKRLTLTRGLLCELLNFTLPLPR
jgi:hypothetical protein